MIVNRYDLLNTSMFHTSQNVSNFMSSLKKFVPHTFKTMTIKNGSQKNGRHYDIILPISHINLDNAKTAIKNRIKFTHTAKPIHIKQWVRMITCIDNIKKELHESRNTTQTVKI